MGKRRISELAGEAQKKLDDLSGQRDEFANEYFRAQSRIEELEASNDAASAKFESVLEKSKLLARNVRILKSERENTKVKITTIQSAFVSLKRQTTALQKEFEKTHEFYRRELRKSLKKRKDLEAEVKTARAEQEAFTKQLESSVLEHGSTENMVVAAQLRLGQIEVLERNIGKLESENTRLQQEAKRLKLELESQERDLAKLDELRMHNKQLVRCVEALEDSRRDHEVEAERYRQQAGESEKLSDTLRLKLDDLERNFADMEKQQDQAIKDARKAAVVPIMRKQG